MDHIRILRRAFEITWRYRALWVFGILVSLFTARGSNPGGSNGNSSGGEASGISQYFRHLFGQPYALPTISSQAVGSMIAIGITLVCLAIIFAVIVTIVRYVASAAMIRMVDRYEASGERVRVGEGFRLGWSRGTFRIWLVDLIFGVAGFIAAILLLGLAAAPLLLWLTRDNTLGVIGTVITVGLGVLVILVLVLAFALLGLLVQIIHRVILLEGQGVFEGIQRGWEIARRRPGDVIIMGLILFGIGLAFALVMIPFVILLLVIGGLVGGLPGLAAWTILSQVLHTPNVFAILVGLAIGLPFFLLVMVVPLAFIGGLMETFTSSVWTLTYRELLALETAQGGGPAAPLIPAAPGAEVYIVPDEPGPDLLE